MNKKRIFIVFVVLVLAGSVLNFHAGISAALPANEPWTIESIGWRYGTMFPEHFIGQYI